MTLEEHDPDDKLSLPKTHSYITIDINISRELYYRIRLAASQNKLSLNEYLEHILGEAVPGEASLTQRERRPATRKMLEELRQVREEILQDRGGKPFEEDSTELIRQMREERSRYLEEL